MSDATLRQVARQAGVSLSTASQALNNRPNVSAETRTRVLDAAIALGYQQQIRSSSPATTDIRVVGLLIKEMPDSPLPANPFYSHIMVGVERECKRQNFSLMFANVEVNEQAQPVSWPSMVLDNRVDGLLIVGPSLSDFVGSLDQQSHKPIVLVDAYSPDQHWDSVVIDNVNGADQAVSYLIKQGHERIGLIGGAPEAHPSVIERRKGYTRALKRHGISQMYIEHSALLREASYEAALRLLQRSPEITAIFASNDLCALGVMKAAEELGRAIPDDLSLVGFDDIDLAQEVKPALTTVHVDKVLMGVLGVRHLRDRADDPERTTVTTMVSTRLVIRDSVRRIQR